MAQKKKSSAFRTASVNIPVPSSQRNSAPVWLISSASYDSDSREAGAVPEIQAETVAEASLSETGGGGQSKRDVTDKALGKGVAPIRLSNGTGKGLLTGRSGGCKVTNGAKDEFVDSAQIKGECEKALVALRRGNSTKALKLMKDVCSRNEASSLAYRVQGHILMRIAAVIEDTTTKKKHFQSALESARKAASLSPRSVEYAQFYAQLLYEAAKDSRGYELVVQECERALHIDEPIDPASESLHDEQEQELLTAEVRIEHVKQELRNLVQKASLTSISTWMKTFGNGAGEEKLRFVQMRKFAEQDTMEQRVSQPKRPHDVKKVVKTPEERRKEIEVRVAAARLLQQRDSTADVSTESTEDHEKTLQKKLERRKSSGQNSRKVSKPLSVDERTDRVRQFWHNLTSEKRESMLEVPIAELKDHLTSWKESGGLIKSHAASDALSEALEFVQEKKTWRFWACCKCGERFTSYHNLSHHTLERHMPSLPQKFQQMIPQEIDQEWVHQLLDEECSPIDGAAAVKLLIQSACSYQSDELESIETIAVQFEDLKLPQKSDNEVTVAESVETSRKVDFDAFEDIEVGLGPGASGLFQEHLHTCVGDCQKEKKINRSAKIEIPSQDLPLAEDKPRRKLLEKIYNLFRTLIRNKCLAHDHVAKIIQFATEETQSLVSDPALPYEFNQSPVYIRFLELSSLQRLHNYLLEFSQACGLNFYLESTVLSRIGDSGEEEVIQDQLTLNDDFTRLLLDVRVLKEFPEERVTPSAILVHGGVKESVAEKDPVAHRHPLCLILGETGEPGTKHMDLQLSWMFGTLQHEYLPSGWKQYREQQGQRGRDVCRALEKELENILDLCRQKYELLSNEEALNLVERLCIEENKRRELQLDGTINSFEAVLKGRQQELLDARMGGFSSSRKSELDVITDVLRDAQTEMGRRHPNDGSLGVRVSEWDEYDESWIVPDSIHRADSRADEDSRVEDAMFRQREQLSNKINLLDAKIMRATDDLEKLEVKLGQLAVLDYTAVTLPLVKNFLQSRLAAEAERDAMRKSDAAQEAFLAELAMDQKRLAPKEVEHQKQTRDKSKEKKKAKDQKKSKDLKRGPSHSELQVEVSRVDSLELDEDFGGDHWDWVVGDESKQQRDFENQHQALLLEEERKLMEALELQRRLEEEAKQKLLAEQERKRQIAQHTTQALDNGKEAVGTRPTVGGLVDVVNSELLPSSSTQLLVAQDGCQYSTEVAEPVTSLLSLSIDETYNSGEVLHPSLPPQKIHSVLDRKVPDISGNVSSGTGFDLEVTEQYILKDACHITLEKASRTEVLPSEGGFHLQVGDSDLPSAGQKKTKGGSNRNRRRKGPRIYAEEGIVDDQDPQSCNTFESYNDSKTYPRQNVSKEHGASSTIDKSKPLLRQNATRNYGAAPTNSAHAAQPLLLLPAPPAYEGSSEHEVKKTLRQLQAEQDDEERFQADLEQAMRQSLDMLASQSAAPAISGYVASSLHTVSPNCTAGDCGAQELVETGTSTGFQTGAVEALSKEVEEFGKGLRNEIGQYNCFLNVVIQSLWHLRRFREALLADTSTHHVHVGTPCVVCALRDIFLGLNTPVHNTSSQDAVAPIALRVALSALYPDSDLFKQGQMNDASEVLAVIFECLHKAFVPNATSVFNSESSLARGSWDCYGAHACMAHALFGLHVAEQMNCQSCQLESRHLKYTAFFHHINASALRTAKALYGESSMDELLKLVDMNDQLACDITDAGGCGRQNHMHHLLQSAPHVFTIVLGWQNGRESFEDITATVDAIDVTLDVGVIYCGLDKGLHHRLVSIICYYGLHYHCFAYNQELGRWVMFDDSTVKVIGEWKEVASTCRRGHLQPQVLFYEAVAARSETFALTVC